jgi:hypothetical protein
MSRKLLFSTAALAGFAFASTPALTQPAGCMSNCPGTNQQSTTGQASEKSQQAPADQKTSAGQSGTTTKPPDQRPQKSSPDARGK